MRQPFQIFLSVLMLLTALELSKTSPGYSAPCSTWCELSDLEWLSGQRNNPPTPSTPGGSRWHTTGNNSVQSASPEPSGSESACIPLRQ